MIRQWAYRRLRAYAQRRDPSDPRIGLVIGGADDPYMRRWFLIPRNRLVNVYLHQIVRDDDDRALHDHPWVNLSWILAGGYREVLFDGVPEPGLAALPAVRTLWRMPGFVGWRRARVAHRLVLGRDRDGGSVECWSLFLTGPTLRSWGFWCADAAGGARWVHWRRFTAGARGELTGAGCGA
jgi:hypothetical protein